MQVISATLAGGSITICMHARAFLGHRLACFTSAQSLSATAMWYMHSRHSGNALRDHHEPSAGSCARMAKCATCIEDHDRRASTSTSRLRKHRFTIVQRAGCSCGHATAMASLGVEYFITTLQCRLSAGKNAHAASSSPY